MKKLVMSSEIVKRRCLIDYSERHGFLSVYVWLGVVAARRGSLKEIWCAGRHYCLAPTVTQSNKNAKSTNSSENLQANGKFDTSLNVCQNHSSVILHATRLSPLSLLNDLCSVTLGVEAGILNSLKGNVTTMRNLISSIYFHRTLDFTIAPWISISDEGSLNSGDLHLHRREGILIIYIIFIWIKPFSKQLFFYLRLVLIVISFVKDVEFKIKKNTNKSNCGMLNVSTCDLPIGVRCPD